PRPTSDHLDRAGIRAADRSRAGGGPDPGGVPGPDPDPGADRADGRQDRGGVRHHPALRLLDGGSGLPLCAVHLRELREPRVSAPDLDGFLGPVLAEMGVRHGPLDAVQLFTLGFARWAPIFAITPFLGGKLVPNSIRVGLTLLFAIVVLPWQSRLAPLPLDLSAIAWWAILLREV